MIGLVVAGIIIFAGIMVDAAAENLKLETLYTKLSIDELPADRFIAAIGTEPFDSNLKVVNDARMKKRTLRWVTLSLIILGLVVGNATIIFTF